MSESIEEATASARRAVAAARRATGEPWQDDSDKDVFQLKDEAEAIRDRLVARCAYEQWQRKHRWTWRWRTYRPDA